MESWKPLSFAPPTVNVGARQQGRERARNVIDAPPEHQAILAAIAKARSVEFRESLLGMRTAYGEGRASEMVVRVLCDVYHKNCW